MGQVPTAAYVMADHFHRPRWRAAETRIDLMYHEILAGKPSVDVSASQDGSRLAAVSRTAPVVSQTPIRVASSVIFFDVIVAFQITPMLLKYTAPSVARTKADRSR